MIMKPELTRWEANTFAKAPAPLSCSVWLLTCMKMYIYFFKKGMKKSSKPVFVDERYFYKGGGDT